MSVISTTIARAQENGAVPLSDRDAPSLYPIEIEPHVVFGAENVYGATGFGAGLRVSIPVVFGLLKRVPDIWRSPSEAICSITITVTTAISVGRITSCCP